MKKPSHIGKKRVKTLLSWVIVLPVLPFILIAFILGDLFNSIIPLPKVNKRIVDK